MACLHFLDSYSVSGFRFFTLVAAQPAPRRLARKTTGRLSMTDAPPSGEAKPGCQRGPVCLCDADACPLHLCATGSSPHKALPNATKLTGGWPSRASGRISAAHHWSPSGGIATAFRAKQKRSDCRRRISCGLRVASPIHQPHQLPPPASPITSTSQGSFKRPGSSVGGPGMEHHRESTEARLPEAFWCAATEFVATEFAPALENDESTGGVRTGRGPLCQNHGLSTWGQAN